MQVASKFWKKLRQNQAPRPQQKKKKKKNLGEILNGLLHYLYLRNGFQHYWNGFYVLVRVHRPVKVNWEYTEGHVHLEDWRISNMASWRSQRGRSNLNHRVLHQTQEVYTELICTQTQCMEWPIQTSGFYWNHMKERIWYNVQDRLNLAKQCFNCQFHTSNTYKSVPSKLKQL